MSDSPIKIKLADKLVMGEWVARYWNGSFVGWHMVVKPFRANIVLTVSRTADEPVQEFETAAAAPVEVWAGQGEPPYYGPGDYKNARALQGLKEENARLKEENARLVAAREEADASAEHALTDVGGVVVELRAQLDATRKERDAARKERDRVSADLVHTLHTLEEIEGLVGKLEKVAATEKPPMEAAGMTTLPQWLFGRYQVRPDVTWAQLSFADRAYWTGEAMAVLCALEGEGLIKGKKTRAPWGIARHLSLPLDLLPKTPSFSACCMWSRWDPKGLQYEYYVEVPPNHIDAPDPPDWLVPIFAYAREHNAHGVLFHSRSKTKYDPLTSPKMRG